MPFCIVAAPSFYLNQGNLPLVRFHCLRSLSTFSFHFSHSIFVRSQLPFQNPHLQKTPIIRDCFALTSGSSWNSDTHSRSREASAPAGPHTVLTDVGVVPWLYPHMPTASSADEFGVTAMVDLSSVCLSLCTLLSVQCWLPICLFWG